MKNNIKYAGIAAAALLTVAPLATPIVNSVSNTQVAQAADNDATQAEQDALSNYFSTFRDSVSTKDAFAYFDDITSGNYNKAISYADFSKLASVTAAGRTTVNTDDNTTLSNSKITFKIASLNGSSIQSLADFNTKLNSVKNNGGTLNIQFTASDANGNQLATHSMTFSKTNETVESVTDLNVSYTNPLVVAKGSNVVDTKYTTSVDATVSDQNGNDVKVTTVTPSQDIYLKESDALNHTNGEKLTGATFDTAGQTYYQAVNLTLDNSVDASKIFENMQHGRDGKILLNGANAVQANVLSGNTIKIVRQINVSDKTTPTDGDWTKDSINGVVTVTSSIGHLYNDDNQMTSRSLGANSGWQTDTKRTNTKTGQVQYRVSTHEWVNADDVSYQEKGSSTNGLGNITDVTGRHVVSLAGPSGFVYTLFNSQGKTATRGLAGETAWLVDKIAKDADGNTYYRVSTDEWVKQSTGVSYE